MTPCDLDLESPKGRDKAKIDAMASKNTSHQSLENGSSLCYLECPVSLTVKKGCFSASDGVILLSGLSVKQRSRRSMKWLSSLDSASVMPPDAAKRRVRRSRVGLTMAKVRSVVW